MTFEEFKQQALQNPEIRADLKHRGVEPDTVFRGRASAILAKMLVNAQSIACAF